MISLQKPPTIQFVFTLLLALILPSSAQLLSGKLGDRIVPKIHEKLDNIILPLVILQDATIEDSCNFIISRCIETDKETIANRKGVSIVKVPSVSDNSKLKTVKKNPPLINYQARKISVSKLLTEIAKQSKHDLYLTSAGVVFCPPGKAPFPNELAKQGVIWDVLYKHKAETKKVAPKLKPKPVN
ncbi:MAG: hypothetical protein ACI9E1_000700 [Cryomorphaceae bacterium]|jgi:hypothetical protein